MTEKGVLCTGCPVGMVCMGGDRTYVEAGFWRPNNYSDKVLNC